MKGENDTIIHTGTRRQDDKGRYTKIKENKGEHKAMHTDT